MAHDKIVSRLIVPTVKFSGLWFGERCENSQYFYGPILRVSIMIMVFLATALSLHYIGFRESLNGVLIFFPALFIVTLQTLSVLINNGKMKDLLETLDTCVAALAEPWMLTVLDQGYRYANLLLKLYNVTMVITWLFYFTLPLIADITIYFFGYDHDRVYTLILPLSGYLDKVPSRSLKNSIILMISIIWSMVSFPMHSAFMTLFCYSVMYTHAIIKIFNLSIDVLVLQSDHDHNELKKIVKMHQNIVKLGQSLSSFYGLPFIGQNILVSLCLCMCVLVCSSTSDNNVFMAYAFGTFYYFSISVMCCSLGQLIEIESDKMLESISNIPWHTMQPKVRRDIAFMMLQANTNIEISFKGNLPLNFNTLMKILNKAYSYFMVLRTLV